MHKTYSLRDDRIPTASEMVTPRPPTSTTKSMYFGKSSIGASFRKNTAGSFRPELARKLSQYIKTEKNILRGLEIIANERKFAAKQISSWGYDQEEDISDITDKIGVLVYEMGELQDQFIDKHDQYRVTLKSIRNIEGSVQPTRDRKIKITDEIASIKYKDPHSPRITILEQELIRAEAESLVAEAQLSNVTREKFKLAFNYEFDSIREVMEKFAIISKYGKALLELLNGDLIVPGENRPIYDGHEISKQIISDVEHSLDDWTFDTAAIKPNLSMHQTTEDVYGEFVDPEDLEQEDLEEDELEQEENNQVHHTEEAEYL